MKKKFLALLLTAVLVLSMVPMSVVFATANTKATYTVVANKTDAIPGDTVKFEINLDLIKPMTAFEVTISIPDGLTLVKGSQTPISAAAIGFTQVNNNEAALLVSGYSSNPYTATGTITIATFECTVNSNTETSTLSIGLIDTVLNDDEYEEEDHNVVSAKLNIKVPVTGVTLDKKTLSLDTGSNNTATLTATVDPTKATDKTVIWKSSDDKIATVDNNGKVTAVKKGTAVITVTTNDGKFTDTCTVTVSCAHTNKTKSNAKAANCVNTGWEDYYTCNDCGQLFAANGLTEIDAIPTTSVDADNHKNVVNYSADPATCVHKGHDAYSKCTACGTVTSGSDKEYYGEHNYGTLINAENEIHTENELKASVAAHYHCSVCDKYFTESKVETTLAELRGTTPSHSYGNWVNTDANQHWKECGCGNKISVANHSYDNSCDTDCNVCGHIRTINHTYSDEWSDDGTNHWHECSVCHKSKSQEGKHAGGTATCKAKAVCSVCGHEYGEYGNCNFVENAKAEYLKSEATCKSPAVYYKSCSVCGKKSNDTFEYGTVNSDNHKNTELRNKKSPTESDKGYTGDTWCFDCEKTVVTGNEIDKLEHTPTKVSEKAATVTEEGICEHYYCENCGKYYSDAEGTIEITKNETILKKLAPEIIDGKGQNVTAGEKKELTFRSNAAFADFIRVELDGNELGSSDYTIKEGSIIVTLKQDYVATLSVGKHTLGIVSASGTAVTEFTVVAADKESTDAPSSPQTGEDSNIAIWMILFILSSLTITVIVLRKRKVR